MSGHSKWATTKHKKAAIDAKGTGPVFPGSRQSLLPSRMRGRLPPARRHWLASSSKDARAPLAE